MSELTEITITELNKRNTVTVEDALKDMYAVLYNKQEQIDLLCAGIATLQNRMCNLEQQLIIQKVQLVGLGSSVRE